MPPQKRDVVIIGAGPAGLTAAYVLTKRGVTGHGARGRHGRRRDQPHRASATAGASTSAATASSPRCSRSRTSGSRSSARRGLPAAARGMSRIYYRGKFYDYPLRPMNALRNLGPVEAVRCVAVVPLGAGPPAEGPDARSRASSAALRLAPLPALLQDLHREGLGRAGHGDPGRLGRAAHQEPVAVRAPCARRSRPSAATRQVEQVTSLIEEFNYPKYGPGHDVGALPRARRRPPARKVVMQTPRRPTIQHGDGGATAVVAATPTASSATYPCTDVISSMPIARAAARRWTRRAPDRGARRRRRRCATATSSPSRSSCPRSTASPTTGSTSTTPTSKVGRIQNFGSWSPYLVKDGRTCLGLEYFVNEGDEHVDEARRRPRRAGQARAAATSAWSRPGDGRGRLRRADAEGVPGLRRGLQGQRRRAARVARRRTRPTCIPVGRNGMHRYNNQDHSMFTAMLSVENILAAPTTTCGRSTSRRSTTRSRRARSVPGLVARVRAMAAPVATRRFCRVARPQASWLRTKARPDSDVRDRPRGHRRADARATSQFSRNGRRGRTSCGCLRRRDWAAVGIVVAVLLGLALRFLSRGPLWEDEAQSLAIAHQPLSHLAAALRHDGAPPLYYVLLHWWVQIFGTSTFAVRALSAIPAVLALPVILRLGRRIGGDAVGIAAVVLLAVSAVRGALRGRGADVQPAAPVRAARRARRAVGASPPELDSDSRSGARQRGHALHALLRRLRAHGRRRSRAVARLAAPRRCGGTRRARHRRRSGCVPAVAAGLPLPVTSHRRPVGVAAGRQRDSGHFQRVDGWCPSRCAGRPT